MVGDILQPSHLLFVLVVALVVLGPKRLPEVGRTLGEGLRGFKSALTGEPDRYEDPDETDGRDRNDKPLDREAEPVAADDSRRSAPAAEPTGPGEPTGLADPTGAGEPAGLAEPTGAGESAGPAGRAGSANSAA